MSYHDGSAWRYHMYTPWTPSTDTWYHVAVSRDSTNTIRTFINGQQTGSLVNTNSLTSGSQNMFIGGINGLSASSMNGYIDEVRISKGIARWTANFTPPDHEYGPAVAPVADFTATPLTGTAPLTVQFTDTSTHSPAAWSWDFGDGDSTNATVQDPVHTYASAGTYTVSLTAANAAGADTEVKVGYVEVTEPLPVAVNVLSVKSGDDEYTGDAILDTANIQSAMGYDPIKIDGYALNVRETIRSLLSTSHILLINGHSTGGFIQVNKQNDEGCYGKALLPGEYEFNEIESYSDMDLAIFLGCNSGDQDYFHGNLVDVIGDKEGRCAMGWTEILNVAIAPYYNTELWNQIQQSNTIYNSHLAARDAVAADGFCQYLHQTNPNQYTEYCNQDALYYRENDNGCHVALPIGIIPTKSSSQSVQSKMIEIKPSATSITQSEKTISQFAKIPVTDVHYSATTHKTEGTVYEYTSDQSFFRVNEKNNRVQTARWLEPDLQRQKEIIDLDKGYVIAESFAREKYNELWNISDTRDTKVITKKVLDSGGDRELQYEWWEIYYSPKKKPSPIQKFQV
jgi:PKD repeat protein